MRLKLYRAPRMAEAMARIRSELGPEALILASRRVGDGVEVTAALEPADDPPAPIRPADLRRLAALGYHAVPPGLAERLAGGDLPGGLEGALRFAALPTDRPLLLIGPPGAGKTLSAARLATRHVLGGVTPTVITADGKRAGAAEQLAAYTRLLGLELLIASTPVTLGRALARPRGAGPVLIDTAGSDPFQATEREEIAALAATASANVALVLPAGLCPQEAAELAAAYAEAGASLLIATRLDLARRLGGVLAAAEAGRLALAEAGIGPGAADGLAPFTPAFLAARLVKPGASA